MKKTPIVRKHGASTRRLLGLDDVREAAQAKPRLKTHVTFETSLQSYLWTTDRGRSRLIKH
jgi:hypothetical protein